MPEPTPPSDPDDRLLNPAEDLPAAPAEDLPAVPAEAACPVPAEESSVTRVQRALLLGIARGVDVFYVAFQGALKSFGLVPPDAGPPPEETTDDGRFAVLPRRPDRWPELRVRLPDTAVCAFSVEGVFRRSALWRSWEERGAVVAACRAATAEAWPSVEEVPGDPVHVFAFEAGGVRSLVKVSSVADGGVMIGVGQKIGRLRFDEAERRLGGGADA